MFNSTLMDFDLGMFANSPSIEAFNEAYGQDAGANKTLAQHMEDDKRMADCDTMWLEATSDLQSFMELTDLPEVNETSEEEVIDIQALISDVEECLQKHEPPTSIELSNNTMKEVFVDCPLANSTFCQEETDAAEKLLDELLKGDISLDFDLSMLKDEAAPADEVTPDTSSVIEEEVEDNNTVKVEVKTDDSGFFDMSNVTQIVTEDGRNIVIFIAPPSPAPAVIEEEAVIAPMSVASASSFDSEDTDWAPESPKITKGRPVVKRSAKRSIGTTKKTPYFIKDKKERKKMQNVEAARRYRDKKKAEQSYVETEEEGLTRMNKGLKGQLSELEAEVKTMKKLMMELGILKQK
jgi:hypothetical protein